ncbi:MAG: ferrous iron transporter B, partial [Pseudomonadales bacterium]|nr:ferrous iron transporter B [Pseudomonadales bacterium]
PRSTRALSSAASDVYKRQVGESRAGLSLAKRALTSYMESNWDGMHLSNVPTTLNTVWGGLTFLQLERAANVMKSCEGFIHGRLINDRSNEPDEHLMETLADAITSIDYYLESIENNKPIGEGVLDVAEESMDELGYPSKAA